METFSGDRFDVLADGGKIGKITGFSDSVKTDNGDILRDFFVQGAQGADGVGGCVIG